MRFLAPEHRDIRRRAITVVAVSVSGLSFGALASESGLSIANTSALSFLVVVLAGCTATAIVRAL